MEPTLLAVKSRCDDGSTVKYYTDLAGNKQGYYIKRYKNGKIASKICFEKNVLNGLCTSFFPDGSIEYKTTYKDGKRHGHYRQWNTFGKLVHHLIYRNGIVIDVPFSIAKKIPLNKIYKTYDD
jgi:antitoxin component YwqK of YwqJK toxin-antitoxin module